uniref:uncharacterized protein LOC122606302 n=1 Tax=Erigeron canadensis TaxID=72917 RepID=UPI001CB8D3F9|nr:uncharacterized protein LOC122606302 [Erigeron canadensis]
MRPGDSTVNSQLIEVTDYTFHQVVLSPTLLFKLNRNANQGWQTTAVVFGRKENAKVNVTYHYYGVDGLNGRVACGFEGIGWRNFCSQNNLCPGYKLKFTNNADLTFTVDVFGPNGNIVDVHKEVFTDNKEMNFWPSSSDDDEPKSHKCRHAHPAHSKRVSHFFQTIRHHTVARNEMTVPKFFVRKHKLFNYGNGILHFGQLNFPFHLAPRLDARRPRDLTHQVMIMDWTYFMGHTRVEEDEKSRFQFNPDDNHEDGTLHLDVC